jgi:hypothetical protein
MLLKPGNFEFNNAQQFLLNGTTAILLRLVPNLYSQEMCELLPGHQFVF